MPFKKLSLHFFHLFHLLLHHLHHVVDRTGLGSAGCFAAFVGSYAFFIRKCEPKKAVKVRKTFTNRIVSETEGTELP